jgi:hypothetical protein
VQLLRTPVTDLSTEATLDVENLADLEFSYHTYYDLAQAAFDGVDAVGQAG